MEAAADQADPANDERASLPLVSVIVPHYNDLVNLSVCHARLMEQDWPRDQIEVIVADNNSRCGMDAVRDAAPGATVILQTAQGAGLARNAGVACSRGSILAFLDSDCVPEPHWIAQGVAALARFDFIGGKVLVFPRDRARPNPIEAYEMVFNFDFRRYIEEVGFTGSGNMFVRRDVFDRVGGFRAGVSEDMDWSFRARQLKFSLGYADAAVVGHPARWEWVELRRRWSRMIHEDVKLVRERGLGPALFIMKALIMPLSIPPHAVKIARSERLHGLRSRLGAMAVLARLQLWRAVHMLGAALNLS